MAVSIGTVVRVVAKHFDVSVADVLSDRRMRQVLPARHVAAYLAHTLSGLSHREIGQRLGGRDYTIIAMYCRAVSRHLAKDAAFGRVVEQLLTRLRDQAAERDIEVGS